jgi:hypothetical protein
MLVATILGVCLSPMLYVLVMKVTGGTKAVAAPVGPPPVLATEHAHGGH